MNTDKTRTKKWRHKHPEKWYAQRAKYYRQSRESARYARSQWNENDIIMLQADTMPDPALAQMLGRSIQAIQQKRFRLKLTKQ